jgi:hypothetical protein
VLDQRVRRQVSGFDPLCRIGLAQERVHYRGSEERRTSRASAYRAPAGWESIILATHPAYRSIEWPGSQPRDT